ncbi:hypothetical protein ACWDBO_29965 [Streptomyces mirabilis]|uniref:hypothetical protein n=1 Tax=Streptomyces mirabilis TaxID=68239 RepID=UPI003334245E
MNDKVKITREPAAGHDVLIADGDWACVPGTQPLVEGTPDAVREYCWTHPRPARG